ncbi:MAG TPA: VCBS repeat-containing protein [Pyrinomonadaceae bacterium]|nr:VCBS repeat-containing protein [Pyrinomonadaceae bacterium]
MFHRSSAAVRRILLTGVLLSIATYGTLNVFGGVVPVQHVVDFDGNGRTDFAVGRIVGTNQLRWIYALNPSGATAALDWGLVLDEYVPEDYDGDGKTDVAVWRPGAPGVAAFYILNSQTNTVRIEVFGQTDDDPRVVGDYNNDGRADVALFRDGLWLYKTSAGGPTIQVVWGVAGDFPAPGDYNGDGSNDFVIQRNGGSGQGVFWIRFSGGGSNVVTFGLPNDLVVPGDYDGDAKTDIAVARRVTGGPIQWYWLQSSNGVARQANWGLTATDRPVQGDYDGDGKTDIAIWRSSGVFWVFNSATSTSLAYSFGTAGDYPIANFNVH